MLGFGKVSRSFDWARGMHVWMYDDDPSRTFEVSQAELVAWDTEQLVEKEVLAWVDACDAEDG